MADVLIKTIRKKTLRTKESLRETFGKVDKTTDENFEESCNEFNKQQKIAERLQKELKNYIFCLKAVNQAGKGLYEAVREAYEPHWNGVEHVRAITDSLDLLWDDYLQTLNDDALLPLNYYCSQFADLRTKIAKRGRKLVDYDAARHAFNSVQSSSRKDDVKLQKAKDQMNIAKKLYDDLNNELLVALPELYDARVDFTVNNFKVLFKAEKSFHGETAKLDDELWDELNKMKIDENKTLSFKERAKAKDQAEVSPLNGFTASNNLSPSPKPDELKKKDGSNQALDKSSPSLPLKSTEEERATDKVQLYPRLTKANYETNARAASTNMSPNSEENDKNPFNEGENRLEVDHTSSKTLGINNLEDSGKVPEKSSPRINRTAEKLLTGPAAPHPPVVLYKARATHRYSAEDTDELTFEAGDIISVIPYEDPEEQDEGWLNGIKESTGEKGVFPENFTKPL